MLDFPSSPSVDQVHGQWQWNGTAWVGAGTNAAGGDITAVLAGSGLSGGGSAGDVTLSLAAPVAIASGGTSATTAGAALANLGGIAGNQTITLSGDLSGSGTTAIAATLATVPIAKGGTSATTAGAALANLGGIAGNQTITLSGDLSGSGTTAIAATLATVPIAKGGTSSTSAPAALTALGALPLAGGTMTGALTVTHGGGIPVVLNTPTATDCHLEFHNGSTGQWKIGAMGYSSVGQFFIYDVQRGRNAIAIDTVGACFNITGTWSSYSDPILKEAIEPYARGLDAINNLNCVSYRYKAGTPFAEDEPSRVLYGLLADEVLPHIPEVCGETTITVMGEETTVATLNPGDLIFALINAVKELAVRVGELEARPPHGPEMLPA